MKEHTIDVPAADWMAIRQQAGRGLLDVSAAILNRCRQSTGITLIHPKLLFADCLLQCLMTLGFRGRIRAFRSVDEFIDALSDEKDASLMLDDDSVPEETLVLLYASGRPVMEIRENWTKIYSELGPASPVILLDENTDYIFEALEAGIRGFIPESLSLKVAAQAIDFVIAGGTFVPAVALLRSKNHDTARATSALFTGREAKVLDGLVRGASNKIIAYELGMSECTVKIHVRSIMRKLKARNRTHVAFIVHEQSIVTNCSSYQGK